MQPTICTTQKVKGDMSPLQSPKRDSEPPQGGKGLPPEILEIIWPALQVGGLSGMYLYFIRYIEPYQDTFLSSNLF
jgi:hypothetical protein